MANRRSPAEIKINCLYRVQQPEELWSPYSDIFSITVQTPLPPELAVNPPVVTETDSVTLNCQTPPSVSVSQCHFYTLSGGTVREFPCQNTLTGTELLAIANLSSPAEVKVNCYYIVKHPSPYSNLSSITIQRTNQKEERTTYVTTFFPSEMSPTGRESTMTQTTPTQCETTGLDVRTPQLVTAVSSLTTSLTSVKSASGSSTSALLPVTTLNPTSRQKPQMSVHHDEYGVLLICSLPGSVKHDTTCNLYFGEGSRPVETTTIRKKMNSKQQWFCLFTVTLEDFQRFLHSVQQKEVSCDYSSESEPNSLSPRSDGYSLTDILERESIMTRTKSASTMSTESHRLTPFWTFTTTTEALVWKSAVAVAGFVTLVVILLVLALFIKRRTESCTYKRTHGSITASQHSVADDVVCMRNLDHGELLRAGNEGAYEVITSVSANGCSTGSEKLNRQEPQSENIPFRRSTYKTFLNLK
ncbi:mucin-3B-like isoform X1 [Embiotoca jacksoni]|uniref:mucin-3B-like isoform X1 n=1 Tax=Embiotoca jacksoni TaxID=100190 RepID=UPI00370487B5